MLWQLLDHRYTQAHASAYLEGDLGEGGRRRVERHTSVCPRCRELLASLRHMLHALPTMRTGPRPGLAEGVLERLRQQG